MARLTEKEKDELRQLANSQSLRSDFQTMAKNRHDLMMDTRGNKDPDRFVRFVSQYNEFINHKPRRFRRIKMSIARM